MLARHVGRHTQVPALALLIPARFLGTEHHRSDTSSGPPPPPPGFNADQAKRTPPKDHSAAKKDDISKSATVKEPDPTKEEAKINELVAKQESHAEDKEVLKKEEKEKKLTLWQKVKKEARHYWDGSKLLATEVRISWRLALKMAAGYELTRRENKQLQRTVQDLARLVPFSVFIIVPLGEPLPPLALKLFPNILPTPFEAQTSKTPRPTL